MSLGSEMLNRSSAFRYHNSGRCRRYPQSFLLAFNELLPVPVPALEGEHRADATVGLDTLLT